jgi:hypothetical protein
MSKCGIILFAAILLVSCKAGEDRKANRETVQKSSEELRIKTTCMRDVFQTFELLSQNTSTVGLGASQMGELNELDVSGCPAEFRDNFSSVVNLLDHTKELQLASLSLKNDKNLKAPLVLSALSSVVKPTDKPVSTLEEAESLLDHALSENKKSMEGFLSKLIQIAAEYSVIIESVYENDFV